MKDGGGARQAQILNAAYDDRWAERSEAGVRAEPGSDAVAGAASAASRTPHTHLEIHHTIWWSKGGPTDLDLLIGLCIRCHHPLHRGRLDITGNAVTGFTFTNRTGRPLRRRRRTTHRHAA